MALVEDTPSSPAGEDNQPCSPEQGSVAERLKLEKAVAESCSVHIWGLYFLN